MCFAVHHLGQVQGLVEFVAGKEGNVGHHFIDRVQFQVSHFNAGQTLVLLFLDVFLEKAHNGALEYGRDLVVTVYPHHNQSVTTLVHGQMFPNLERCRIGVL